MNASNECIAHIIDRHSSNRPVAWKWGADLKCWPKELPVSQCTFVFTFIDPLLFSDPIEALEEPLPELTYPETLLPRGQMVSKASPDDDTATEDSDEIRIAPEDSVSQRIPQAPNNLASAPPLHAPSQHDLASHISPNAKQLFSPAIDEPPEAPTK